MTRRVLSPMQWACLYCAARGDTVAETAERLGIAIDTVKEYRSIVLVKLDARNMAQATGRAIDAGVLP